MPTILFYLAIVAVFGLFLCTVIPSIMRMSRRSAAVQKHAKEIMQDRCVLSPAEFGSEFFPPEQSPIATRLREILKDVLIVDVSRMHPDDRLIEDLGLGQVAGLDSNFLEENIKREFSVSLRPVWSSIKTVRDLVTYVSGGARGKSRLNPHLRSVE